MNISEIISVKIDDLAMGGEGVAKSGGLAVFVPDSVPGDELKVRIVDLKKNFARGAIVEIVKASPDRVDSKCPLSKACGGCQWQHIAYPAQLKYKTKIVKETFSRLGKLSNIKVNDIIGMKEPWGFRNKIQYPIAGGSGRGARIAMGYYRQGTHDVVDIDRCPIEHPQLSRAAKIVKDTLNKLGYSAPSRDGGKGLFRFLRARIGFGTGEMMLTFVTSEKGIPGAKNLVKEILTMCKKESINVVGICQNLNSRYTNVIMGEQNWTIWGRDFIYDKMKDLKFKVSNTSFYQTNPIQTEVLYDKAVEMAGFTGTGNRYRRLLRHRNGRPVVREKLTLCLRHRGS